MAYRNARPGKNHLNFQEIYDFDDIEVIEWRLLESQLARAPTEWLETDDYDRQNRELVERAGARKYVDGWNPRRQVPHSVLA